MTRVRLSWCRRWECFITEGSEGVTWRLCWTYLDDINRFLCILLKQQHGGGVCVHVESLLELSAVFVKLVDITEAHIVSEGKSC